MHSTGLQVTVGGFGKCAKLSLRPPVLRPPGNIPYGETVYIAFEVLNESPVSACLQYNIPLLGDGIGVVAANLLS